MIVVLRSTRLRQGSFCAFLGVVCLLFSRMAFAQTAPTTYRSPLDLPPSSGRQGGVEEGFLRVEADFWGTYGLRISRNGRVLGPHFFSVMPDSALRGSPEAKRHAFLARIMQGAAIASGLTALGLVVGAVAVRAENRDWTTTAKLLGVGGAASIFLEMFCAISRENELMEAINSYNLDLIRGSLGE